MSFYFHAHQDDWQVHMGANAYDDLSSGGKVVLVFLTAGNADRESDWWVAREDAARASVEVGVRAGPYGDGASWASAMCCYNGHWVPRFAFGNAVCVFFRLPDGGGDGTGFPSCGHQSLTRLHTSNNPMKAIERDDVYSNWPGLVTTLADVVGIESSDMPPTIWHNAIKADCESGHPDHVEVAAATIDAAHWAKGSLSLRGQTQCLALFKGSGRQLPTTPLPPDSGQPKREALFNAYEQLMLQRFGISGTTTSEDPPRVLSWIANQDPPEQLSI